MSANDQAQAAQEHAQGNNIMPSSPRDCLHHNKETREFIKSTMITMLSLDIQASRIAIPGSGLFFTGEEPVEEGCEIFRSEPMMTCVDSKKKTICHYCFMDNSSPIHPSGRLWETSFGERPKVSACTGCRVARFCSSKCQQKAWKRFHKDECKVLKERPTLSPKLLAVHRLLFWQARKLISTPQGQAVQLMESHFKDYMDDEDSNRSTYIIDGGDGIREVTKSKMSIGAVWRLFATMLSNCFLIRHAHHNEPFGVVFDLATSTINHSCAPNAFIFYEGHEIRIRSLSRIRPGEEITISYIDPTVYVTKRIEILKIDHFFECQCSRCRAELKEEKQRLGRKSDKVRVLHEVQKDIVELMSSAVLAMKNPGLYPAFEDPNSIQYKLLHLARRAFPGNEWFPDHLDPMPSARLCLAELYLRKEKLPVALRLILKGKLCSQRRSGPDFVNEMFEVMRVLIMVGNLPNDAPEFSNSLFPRSQEIQTVTYGYLFELCKEASKVYGGDCKYAMAVGDMFSHMAQMAENPRPGSKGFKEKFEPAQGKLLAWAGINEAHGIMLSR